jgi:hypothetical protein
MAMEGKELQKCFSESRRTVNWGNAMKKPTIHEPYCFAGQPAPCPDYFTNDVLPCVCGVNGNVLSALSQVVIQAVPMEEAIPEIHVLPLSA